MGSMTISPGHWQLLADTLNRAKTRNTGNDIALFDMCEAVKELFPEDFPQLAEIMAELNELLYADMRKGYRTFNSSAPELKLVENNSINLYIPEFVGLLDFITYQFHSEHHFLEKLAKLRNKVALGYVRGLSSYKYGGC